MFVVCYCIVVAVLLQAKYG